MIFSRCFHLTSIKSLLGVFLVLLLIASPAYSVDTQDAQIFITGFNAYLKKDYQAAINSMSSVLQKYPGTPLRDMALFWLSNAHYKAGNLQESGKYMAQFFKEYPSSSLKETVDENLVELAGKYQRGEPISAGSVVTAAESPSVVAIESGSKTIEGLLPDSDAAEVSRLAKEKAEQEKALVAKAEDERLAREKADQDKEFVAKAEAERLAKEKTGQEQELVAKAEAEQLAKEKAEQEKQLVAGAETERLAKEKTGQEQELVAKAEAEQLARQKAEQDKALIAMAEAEHLVRVKAEQDKKLAADAAAARSDRESAAQKELVAKAEAERLFREKAAQEKVLVVKAETATQLKADSKTSRNASLRQMAIDEYKRIIDQYPGTQAAVNASARLRALGIDYGVPPGATVAAKVPPVENANILSVEVGQIADLEFGISAETQAVELGRRFNLPFELVNRGNSSDSFILESGFPTEYRPRFMSASTPDLPLVNTTKLLPGERFKGILQFEMPAMSIDGERKLFPIRAFSETDVSASQSRAIRLTAKAPILRTLIKTDMALAKPGEQVPYRLVLLNVGSVAAKELTLRLTYPPQYEPVNLAASGLKPEGNGTLLLAGLQLNSGESREIAVTMQLKDNALAKEELFLRADMVNTILNRTDNFISSPVSVKTVSGITVKAVAEKLTVVPGQTANVVLVVTNTGNVRDSFTIIPTLPGNLKYAFYLDSNGDGIRQSGEANVDRLGSLSPMETAKLIMEIVSAPAEKDGVTVPLSVLFSSDTDPAARTSANLNLVYSRPVLNLTTVGKGMKVKPGEVSSFELSCINVGSSMAKMVELRSSLPELMEVVAAEPAVTRNANGEYVWHFAELGGGEKRNVRVSYRIKSGTPFGTSLSLKNIITYQDQLGNSY